MEAMFITWRSPNETQTLNGGESSSEVAQSVIKCGPVLMFTIVVPDVIYISRLILLPKVLNLFFYFIFMSFSLLLFVPLVC